MLSTRNSQRRLPLLRRLAFGLCVWGCAAPGAVSANDLFGFLHRGGCGGGSSNCGGCTSVVEVPPQRVEVVTAAPRVVLHEERIRSCRPPAFPAPVAASVVMPVPLALTPMAFATHSVQ